jgi:hypothetical protein
VFNTIAESAVSIGRRTPASAHAQRSRSRRNSHCIVIVAATILSVSCGGERPTYVELMMECPSPDRQLNAVFWVAAGGGAAGWTQTVVTVIPSSVTPSEIATGREDYPAVFRATHSPTLALLWKDDRTLLIEFPDAVAALYAAPGGVYTPKTPHLKMIYASAPSDADRQLVGGSRCVSGNEVIQPQAPRRLVG